MGTFIVSERAKYKLIQIKSVVFYAPGAGVFCNVTLPVTFHCELQPTLITYEWFDTPVRAHVLLQQSLSQVSLKK